MSRPADTRPLVTLTLAGAALGLFVWFGLAPLTTFLRERMAAPVHALALGGCRVPTEHEQLHIVVAPRGNQLVATCMYVGTRGSYTRRSVEITAVKETLQ